MEAAMGCVGMQPQSQCSYYFEDSAEVGAPLTGKCLVQAFAR
ncbi:MAG: hypothetical protein EWM73_02614 [Nitrospira sp.]|nr:MAG: hypothetical protein EWM73_02614 [Nitrospira sp.]